MFWNCARSSFCLFVRLIATGGLCLESRKMLSAVEMSLLKACIGVLAPTEGRYKFLCLRVELLKKKQIAQLNGLLR